MPARTESCDGRVVKTADLKSDWGFPTQVQTCSQPNVLKRKRRRSPVCEKVRTMLSVQVKAILTKHFPLNVVSYTK